VVQPRIQSRPAHLDSFVVIVAALFGGTLFGIVGALLAIPGAAAIQIALREHLVYRREFHAAAMTSRDDRRLGSTDLPRALDQPRAWRRAACAPGRNADLVTAARRARPPGVKRVVGRRDVLGHPRA
jgi:AI-2E family transporter